MMRLSGRWADAIAIGALIALSVIAWNTFRDYGLGWDDYTHSQYGELLLQFFKSGFADKRALSFVNLYMYGGGFDLGAAALSKILPFGLFETRRLCGAVVGILGLAATWRMARRVGGPLAGLLAMLLLATCPLYYGHMFMNAKDAPFAAAMAMLLLGMVRLLEDYPKPGAGSALTFGLGLGLTIGSRVLGGIASLYVALPLVILVTADCRGNGMRAALREFGLFLARLVPAFVLAYAVMALIWPWSVQEPLNPLRAVQYFSHFFEKPWREMFEGQPILVPDMPRSYVPVHFLLKLPEIMLVLCVGGMLGILTNTVRGRYSARRSAILFLIMGAAAVPVLFTILTRPAMYNGIRHFVFVTPPLAVLGGLAGAWLFEELRTRSRAALAAAVAACAIGLADPVYVMHRLHPYEYTHFNRIAGGLEGAEDRFMLDYWGLAFKEASEQLRALLTERHETPPIGRRRWRIAVCGPHPAAEVELGPEFVTTWDPKGADFAMMLGEFYCAEPDAPILVEIDRDNIVYARVYDIRGYDLTSVFKHPDQ
ncbi:MAG TPA: glycosyltransferase family 39 protein [Pseudorhodoplanes sp.]|nr:glycosyltransferase family 39 protein [Pseudorhodoplanes sp.]